MAVILARVDSRKKPQGFWEDVHNINTNFFKVVDILIWLFLEALMVLVTIILIIFILAAATVEIIALLLVGILRRATATVEDGDVAAEDSNAEDSEE